MLTHKLCLLTSPATISSSISFEASFAGSIRTHASSYPSFASFESAVEPDCEGFDVEGRADLGVTKTT